MPDLKQSLGYRYLQETKFNRNSVRLTPRPQIAPTDTIKQYSDAEKVNLPTDWDKHEGSLWQALQDRRSVRKYADSPLNKTILAQLLWATQGVTAQSGPYYLRTAPSAGALYPIETYVVIEDVEDIEPGLFHFDVVAFQLERLTTGQISQNVAYAALEQFFMAKGAVIFIWSAILRRTMSKYGHRGMRYVFMDVGHVCQNLLLAASALGLDACPVAALYDDEMNDLLELDGEEESVIYMASVGPRQ